MDQGGSWPGGIETPLTGMPIVAVWCLPFSPASVSLPSPSPVYSDFETGKMHFEVTLQQLCGLECIIMLCLNYNILWLTQKA